MGGLKARIDGQSPNHQMTQIPPIFLFFWHRSDLGDFDKRKGRPWLLHFFIGGGVSCQIGGLLLGREALSDPFKGRVMYMCGTCVSVC